MVTKQQALDRFIAERVMGNRPIARDDEGLCTYDHAIHGGCEIGQWLPAGPWLQARMGVGDLFRTYPALQDGFEDPRSMFWSRLQLAHDSRAAWQKHLREAALLVEPGR